MNIADNTVVSFHYKLVEDGSDQPIDSSEGQAPLTYLHGAHNLIPGLEKQLTGKKAGDEIEAVVEASEAYGEHDEAMVQRVARSELANVDKIEIGETIVAQTEQGQYNLVITEVGEDEVTLDANHPLAGKTLRFDVVIESVREATPEEVDHGHVHGPGGHHHD